MKIPAIIKSIYAFNLFNRDKWVMTQSKTIPAGSKLLDVGAGSSPYRELFSHCKYFTQDFSQLKPDQLRGYNGYNKIDFVSDINTIPVNSNEFDVILCTEVLEHVPEPISAIKEMSRILKSKGIILITAPLGSGLHQEPYHFYGGYTPYWYEKFLSDNGFESIIITPNMGFYSFMSQEFLRFFLRILPHKNKFNILLLPIVLISFPLAVLLPILSILLDKLDTNKDFTIGYHVKAIKK
jgi:ubiquinone/menaquinone biosynthesis C-methylase UbiE